MTFKALLESSDAETRYLLEERAAIHEYDGGLTRAEAEKRTVEEFDKQSVQVPLL